MVFAQNEKIKRRRKKAGKSHTVLSAPMIIRFIPQPLAAETDETETATTFSASLSIFLCLSISVIWILLYHSWAP